MWISLLISWINLKNRPFRKCTVIRENNDFDSTGFGIRLQVNSRVKRAIRFILFSKERFHSNKSTNVQNSSNYIGSNMKQKNEFLSYGFLNNLYYFFLFFSFLLWINFQYPSIMQFFISLALTIFFFVHFDDACFMLDLMNIFSFNISDKKLCCVLLRRKWEIEIENSNVLFDWFCCLLQGKFPIEYFNSLILVMAPW